jgi:hypothetical protein
MKTWMVALVILAAGCATANRHIGRAALVTSTLTLVCDGMQTMKMAGNGWTGPRGPGYTEMNPIMGERPSTGVVGAYFVGAVVLNGLAWVVTPEKYRAAAPVALTAWQVDTIASNVRSDTGICGF